jgi:hypothetical protein
MIKDKYGPDPLAVVPDHNNVEIRLTSEGWICENRTLEMYLNARYPYPDEMNLNRMELPMKYQKSWLFAKVCRELGATITRDIVLTEEPGWLY